ncbi:ATP-dependent DNA helicase [Trichonephila clavipes]|nr:ATP-dependent DNA helicase [Trichonephila clavipes]
MTSYDVTFLTKWKTYTYAYKFVDCILNGDEAVQYPTEFLNYIQALYLPAHNLILKVGAPIILIRNIDANRLCNGIRLIVKNLMQHIIQATVLTRCAKGEDVFIPRKKNTYYSLRQHHTIQENTVPFETVLCHDNQQVTGPVS